MRGLLFLLLFLGCAEGERKPPVQDCTNLTCDTPPANSCKEGTIRLVYDATGVCEAGRCSYPSMEETCPHRCVSGQCAPPVGARVLVIPENTSLCTRYGWGGDSVRHNWEGKHRATLTAGTLVLEDPIADPTTLLEIWPGVETSKSDLTITSTTATVDSIEVVRFLISQTFTLDARTLVVHLQLDFAENQDTITLDDSTLFDPGPFAAWFEEEWRQIPFIGCHYEYLEEQIRTILVDNGDRITFTVRGREQEVTWPLPGSIFNGELVKTVFVRGSDTREVTNFFSLSSSINHHGCCPGYLAKFDTPLDDIDLIWIDEFSYGRKVNYVDAAGDPIESVPYVDQ